ncbi:MAG: hypothetical protein DDT23_00957 [candidate division WS2 bacterium]|nr:hypothetical protein [Candidatus Lithacetigena glycinireducens]
MELKDLEVKSGKLIVEGASVSVNYDEPLLGQIKEHLKQRGITSFSLFIDGEEVDDAGSIPEYLEDQVIEVKRNAKNARRS